MRIEKVHEAFERYLKKMAVNESLIKLLEQVLLDMIGTEKKAEDLKKRTLKKCLNDLEKEISNIQYRIDKTTNESLIEHYEDQLIIKIAEQKELKNKLNESGYSEREIKALIRKAQKVLLHPLEVWSNADLEQRKRMLLIIFPD